ncbi:MAG TPA: restriction endonuclease subunit S [Candidatus Ozemobacteraceae bacterium]|nr:restriction endonuclease subunit S [Candidatus Ozemobacteraceae bacterium]
MSWKTQKLESVADFCLGKMLDQKKNRGEPLPYLANINVRWGEFDLADLREMRFEQHELDRYGLKNGDIVMCEGGEPGRCAIWKDQRSNMMIQKALHRIRPHDCLLPEFLYYFFLYKGRAGHLSSLFTGSTIKHLPREKLALVEIPVPPHPTQERIISILSPYDNLIENNRRRIQLLEQAARLLYKEWFVHLRFPGHEHTRIIDGIPDGWVSNYVPEIISINPTERIQKDAVLRYIPMAGLSTTDMTIDLTESEMRATPTSVRFRNGDVLLARITPCLENGKTGFIDFLGADEIACGSTEFIVLRGRLVSPYFTYCLARTHSFRETAIKSMIGSSGRQRVQPACFDEFIVPLPKKMILEQFDDAVFSLFRQISTLVRQSDQLVKARDLLLPKLMNGEVSA